MARGKGNNRGNSKPNTNIRVADPSLMADEVKIDENFTKIANDLNKAITSFETAYNDINSLSSRMVSDDGVEGKAYESLVAMVKIAEQYHKQLLDASKALPPIFNTLENNLKKFKKSNTYNYLEKIK